MADIKSGPAESGASTDYQEHEKSYHLFVNGVKYGTMHIVFVLIAMAVGFFTSAGFIFSVLLFIVLSAAGLLFL